MALKFGSERFALICEQYNPQGRNNERKFSHMSIVRLPKMTNEDYGKFYIDYDEEFVMEKIKEIQYIDVSNGRMQMVKYINRTADMFSHTDNYEHIFVRLPEDNMKALLEYAKQDIDYLYTIGSSIFTASRSIWTGQKLEAIPIKPNVFDTATTAESVNMYGIYIENLHYKFKQHKKGKLEHADMTLAPDIDWCDTFDGRTMKINFDSKHYMNTKSMELMGQLTEEYNEYDQSNVVERTRKWVRGEGSVRENSSGQLSQLIQASQQNRASHDHHLAQQRRHKWLGRCFKRYIDRVNDRNWLPFGALLRDVIKHTGSLSFLKAE